MTVRAAFIIAFLAGFLSLGATIDAGVMAKHLPTTKTLHERLQASGNGFQGLVAQYTENIPEENAAEWNQCTEESEKFKKLVKDVDEITTIINYYEITGGSEETLDNFDKWLKEIDGLRKPALDEIQACYNKHTQNLKEADKI
jgi:5'-deoxynucleotidase YfbR-like HD superfamily hydrolase